MGQWAGCVWIRGWNELKVIFHGDNVIWVFWTLGNKSSLLSDSVGPVAAMFQLKKLLDYVPLHKQY
jgi:hypothetical protein